MIVIVGRFRAFVVHRHDGDHVGMGLGRVEDEIAVDAEVEALARREGDLRRPRMQNLPGGQRLAEEIAELVVEERGDRQRIGRARIVGQRDLIGRGVAALVDRRLAVLHHVDQRVGLGRHDLGAREVHGLVAAGAAAPRLEGAGRGRGAKAFGHDGIVAAHPVRIGDRRDENVAGLGDMAAIDEEGGEFLARSGIAVVDGELDRPGLRVDTATEAGAEIGHPIQFAVAVIIGDGSVENRHPVHRRRKPRRRHTEKVGDKAVGKGGVPIFETGERIAVAVVQIERDDEFVGHALDQFHLDPERRGLALHIAFRVSADPVEHIRSLAVERAVVVGPERVPDFMALQPARGHQQAVTERRIGHAPRVAVIPAPDRAVAAEVHFRRRDQEGLVERVVGIDVPVGDDHAVGDAVRVARATVDHHEAFMPGAAPIEDRVIRRAVDTVVARADHMPDLELDRPARFDPVDGDLCRFARRIVDLVGRHHQVFGRLFSQLRNRLIIVGHWSLRDIHVPGTA